MSETISKYNPGNLEFKFVGSAVNPSIGKEDYDLTDEWFEFERQLDEIENKSTLVKYFFADGSEIMTSKINHRGGKCGCCQIEGFSISQVTHVWGFA